MIETLQAIYARHKSRTYLAIMTMHLVRDDRQGGVSQQSKQFIAKVKSQSKGK